jgi:hypothetical protein
MKRVIKNIGYLLLYIAVVFLIIGTIKNYVCVPFIK